MYRITPIGLLNGTWQPVSYDDQDYLAWLALGNVPEKSGFQTVGELAQDAERQAAIGIARTWFGNHPSAATFVRLTPAEQETQIDAMTTAQLKTLLKYLTVAVSFIIKRQLL
jgi:hypothetical protein